MHGARSAAMLFHDHRNEVWWRKLMRNILFALVAVLGVAGAAVSTADNTFACEPGQSDWRGECNWSGE
jgi:hypothetical protein